MVLLAFGAHFTVTAESFALENDKRAKGNIFAGVELNIDKHWSFTYFNKVFDFLFTWVLLLFTVHIVNRQMFLGKVSYFVYVAQHVTYFGVVYTCFL